MPSLRRFWAAVKLSSVSVSGIDRLFVIASWPLLLIGTLGHGMGFRAGYRQRLAEKSAGAGPADATERPVPAAEPER